MPTLPSLFPKNSRRAGLTLIEILIVTVFVGILAAVALPRLGRELQDRGAATAVQSLTMRAVEQQAAAYAANGTFVPTPEGLGLSDQEVLGTPLKLIASVADPGSFAVVAAHWRGGACVGRGARLATSEVSNSIQCDRSFGAPVSFSMSGNTITINVDSAIAAFAARVDGGLGPAAAWAANPADIRGTWLWFDDGAVLGATREAPTQLQHSFTAGVKDRRAMLVIERRDGAVWTGRLRLNAQAGAGTNIPPVATILPSALDVPTGGGVTLDGSGSRDTDGSIVSYAWTFSGGLPPLTGPVARLRFLTPGTYTATLTVTDDLGLTDVDQVTMTATGAAIVNQSPVARVSANGVPAVVGDLLTLDGSASSDPDGSIVSYVWQITGIGPPQMLTGPRAALTLGGIGVATATLTVTDNEGATDVRAIPLTIVAPTAAPSVLITPGVTTTRVGLPVTFSVSVANGDSLTVRWSFGDGGVGSGLSVSHRWRTPGVYTIEALVQGADGTTARGTATVMVEANILPTGKIRIEPSAPVPGQPVSFIGDSLVDIDGTIVFARWLFGDGAYVEGDSISRVFPVSGPQRITLMLQDDAGGRTTIDTTIQVTGGPGAAFNWIPVPPTVGVGATFQALDATGVTYQWSIDGDPWIVENDPLRILTFLNPAQSSAVVTLIVTDGVGLADTVSQVVSLNRAPTATSVQGVDSVGFVSSLVPFTQPWGTDNETSPVGFDHVLRVTLPGLTDADGDGVTVTWAMVDTTTGATLATGAGASFFTPRLTPRPNPYRLQVTLSDGRGGTATRTHWVVQKPQPVPNWWPTPDTLMVGEMVIGFIPRVFGTEWFTWDAGDGRTGVINGETVPFGGYTAPGTYLFTVVWFDEFGAQSVPVTRSVVVVDAVPLAASFTIAPDTVGFTLDPFTFTSTTTGPSGFTLQWAIDGVDFGTAGVLAQSFSTPGQRVIRLIATDGVATDTATRTIFVRNRPPVASFRILPDTLRPEGTVFEARATATDDDGGSLVYRWLVDGVPVASAAGGVLRTSPEAADSQTIALIVYDRQGDSVITPAQNVRVTRVPLRAVLTARPGWLVRDGTQAVVTVDHPLRPGRTHTYQWIWTSFVSGAPITMTGSTMIPSRSFTLGPTDSVRVEATVTDDLGQTVDMAPRVLRSYPSPTTIGFRCTPDTLANRTLNATCDFATFNPSETVLSVAVSPSGTATEQSPGVYSVSFPTPGTYTVTSTVSASTGTPLLGGLRTEQAQVVVKSRGITGVDFTINGSYSGTTDSIQPPSYRRVFRAEGIDLEGSTLTYSWLINGSTRAWALDRAWSVRLEGDLMYNGSTGSAQWQGWANGKPGTGFTSNIVSLVAVNRFGDTSVVAKTIKWAQCRPEESQSARLRGVFPSSSILRSDTTVHYVSFSGKICGMDVVDAADNRIAFRVLANGTPVTAWTVGVNGPPMIPLGCCDRGLPVPTNLAAGTYDLAVEFYSAFTDGGRFSYWNATRPARTSSVRVTYYDSLPPNREPFLNPWGVCNSGTAQLSVCKIGQILGNQQNTSVYNWVADVSDPEGGPLTLRWYINGALVNTQVSPALAPGQVWRTPNVPVDVNAMPLPMKNTFHSVRVTATDTGGLMRDWAVDTIWMARNPGAAFRYTNLVISPAPDTAFNIPAGFPFYRFAFRVGVPYTFEITPYQGPFDPPVASYILRLPDGATYDRRQGGSFVHTFKSPVPGSDAVDAVLGRLMARKYDSLSLGDTTSIGVSGPLSEYPFRFDHLPRTQAWYPCWQNPSFGASGPGCPTNAGWSMWAQVISATPSVSLRPVLSPSGIPDTLVIVGDTIKAWGTTTDDNLTSPALAWSWDGVNAAAFVTNGLFQRVATQADLGVHMLILQATDSEGLVGADTVRIHVVSPAMRPILTLTGATFWRRSPVGDTAVYVARPGDVVTLDPTSSVLPNDTTGFRWQISGASPAMPAPLSLPLATRTTNSSASAVTSPLVRFTTARGATDSSAAILLCRLLPPRNPIPLTVTRFEFGGRFYVRAYAEWGSDATKGLCGGETSVLRRASGADAWALAETQFGSVYGSFALDLPASPGDSLHLAVINRAGAVTSDTLAPWNWKTTLDPVTGTVPPVAAIHHNLVRTASSSWTVAPDDSVARLTSASADASSLAWFAESGFVGPDRKPPTLLGTASSLALRCTPGSSVSLGISLRASNVAGSSETWLRLTCGPGSGGVLGVDSLTPTARFEVPSDRFEQPRIGQTVTLVDLSQSPTNAPLIATWRDMTGLLDLGTGPTVSLSFPTRGTRDIRLIATAPDGSADTLVRRVYIRGTPPNVSIIPAGAPTANRNVPQTVTVTVADPDGDDFPAEFWARPTAGVWTLLTGSFPGGSGSVNGNTATITFNTVGSYDVRAQAWDDDGFVGTSATTVYDVIVGANTPPSGLSIERTPALGDLFTGATYSLRAIGCVDAESDPLSYAWSVTDITGPATGDSTTYSRATAGVTAVTVICSDGQGGADTASVNLTFLNQPPTEPLALTATPPSPWNAGQSVTLQAAGSTDPDGGTISYRLIINSGSITDTVTHNATGSVAYSMPLLPGLVTIDAYAIDGQGGLSTPRTLIGSVTNGAPTCGFLSPSPGFMMASNSPTTLTASGTDPEGNPFQYRWYAGPTLLGTTATGSFPFTNGSPGPVTFGVECFDAFATGPRALVSGTITNTGPVATFINPTNGFTRVRNTTETFTASAVDAEGHTITTWQWYAQGVLVGTTATPSFNFTWPNVLGARTIGVAARDGFGMWGPIQTINGTLVSALGAGSIVASVPAILLGDSVTFTASGFSGATSYTWSVNLMAQGLTDSVLVTDLSTPGWKTIDVSASNGVQTQTATLTNYCVLGDPTPTGPGSPFTNTQNSGGETVWRFVGASGRMQWTQPPCHDTNIRIERRDRINAGAWSGWILAATVTGTSYNSPNLSARSPASIGAPNRFYEFALRFTAGGGTVLGPIVTFPNWVTQ